MYLNDFSDYLTGIDDYSDESISEDGSKAWDDYLTALSDAADAREDEMTEAARFSERCEDDRLALLRMQAEDDMMADRADDDDYRVNGE